MAKVGDIDVLPAKTMDTGSDSGATESSDGVRLKKELGLMNGVAIIVGVIVGSGIFVSPSMALENAGSKGMALIVWVISGFLSMIGALCYAELGTMIPKSGGDYAYLGEAFGPLPAFLYLWVALFIIVPAGNAVTALTFAEYAIKPMWPECDAPSMAISLIAAVLTCFLTLINCYNVKWVTRVQDSFTVAKVLALVVTFFASLAYLFSGHTANLENMMEETVKKPGDIAIALYMGLFSFSGWNYLNYVTEELKDPFRNLPRAIWISMPVVTLVYALTNVAFFAVLSSSEIKESKAVAVVFSEKITKSFNVPYLSWVIPLFVVLCTFGSLNGAIYASSRLFFVGARNGHLPLAISLIDVRRLTPVPSLIFLCVATLVYLFVDVGTLMVYTTAVEALFTIASVAGLLWMRYSHPKLTRPIRVNYVCPILYLLICSVLLVFACMREPTVVGIGICLVALGLPVYWVFIMWKGRPNWLISICNSFNLLCSKIFLCLPEDSKDL